MDTGLIFQKVGDCGLFQVYHVILVQLLRMVAAWALFMSPFTLYNPGWRCASDGNHDNNSRFSQDGSSSTVWDKTVLELASATTVADIHIGQLGNNESHNTVAANISKVVNKSIVTFHGNSLSEQYNWTCDELKVCQSVQFDPGSVTIVTEFDLICDQALVPNIIVFINIVGTLCGCLCGGQIGELFGRKKSLYTNAIFLAASQLAIIFSTSWKMYAAINFFSGFLVGGIFTTNMIYSYEYLNTKWRGIFGGLPIWNLSITLIAGIIVTFKNWRYVHLTTAIVAALAFLGVAWVPESIRWLYVHKKEKEIEAVLKKMAKANRVNINVSEITVLREGMGRHIPEDVNRKYTYFDLFRTSRIRSLTLKSSIAWLLIHVSYYTLTFGTKDLAGDFYVNMLLSGFTEIPVTLLLIPMTIKVGRIWTSLIFQVVVCLCSLVIVIILFGVKSEEGYNIIRYLAIIAKASIFASWSSLSIHSVEIFPTVVRNLAQGFFNTAGMFGVMVAPYLVPEGMLVVSYPVLTASSLITTFLILSLPETNKQPMQEWIVNNANTNEEEEISDSC